MKNSSWISIYWVSAVIETLMAISDGIDLVVCLFTNVLVMHCPLMLNFTGLWCPQPDRTGWICVCLSCEMHCFRRHGCCQDDRQAENEEQRYDSKSQKGSWDTLKVGWVLIIFVSCRWVKFCLTEQKVKSVSAIKLSYCYY